MQRKNTLPTLSFILLLLLLLSSACSTFVPTVPTSTSTPMPTATNTVIPSKTSTPTSTPTPNVTATHRAEALMTLEAQLAEWDAEAQSYFDAGYLTTPEGKSIGYDDFKGEWAQLNWYKTWRTINVQVSDFFLSGHFKWSSAYRQADTSGCGFLFAIQENGDHYAVFLDSSIIRFIDTDRSSRRSRRMGTTRGTGRVNFGNPFDHPAEADFTLIVRGAYAYVFVDSEVVAEYTLSQSKIATGYLGLAILSGTNKDFGTRCEMTNLHLWIPKED